MPLEDVLVQEHQSEYGVHWNFFFTLASVACLTAVVPLSGRHAAAMAVLLMGLYQWLLLLPGWTAWLASDKRDRSSLFDSNKEGLMSLFGYAALCNAGAAAAAILDENNGAAQWAWHSAFRRYSSTGNRGESVAARAKAWHAAMLVAVGVAWVVAFALDAFVQPVSRRFANAAYVMWVSALALTQLQMSALAEVVAAAVSGNGVQQQCPLLDSLSQHQLVSFLVANIATGAVNMTVDTLGASETSAFAIMVAYCLSWGYAGSWMQAASSAWAWCKRQMSGKGG